MARGADHVVVEVAHVGYKVFVPRQPDGDEVLFHTHQVVREDGHFLFGFGSREELALFELLIGVSGVGPRAALALLSISRPAELAAAIAAGDTASLARAPGVGRKTAERLIVDLRGKVARGVEAALSPRPSRMRRPPRSKRSATPLRRPSRRSVARRPRVPRAPRSASRRLFEGRPEWYSHAGGGAAPACSWAIESGVTPLFLSPATDRHER